MPALAIAVAFAIADDRRACAGNQKLLLVEAFARRSANRDTAIGPSGDDLAQITPRCFEVAGVLVDQ